MILVKEIVKKNKIHKFNYDYDKWEILQDEKTKKYYLAYYKFFHYYGWYLISYSLNISFSKEALEDMFNISID